MSLIGFAVRVCTVQALLGQTLAGTAVDDSPVDVVAVAAQMTQPYVAVSTDRQKNRSGGRSLIEGKHRQHLTLHFFVPAQPSITVDGVAYAFQGRDAGVGFAFDLLHRQLELVLMSGQSVWAQLWRRFVNKVHEVYSHAYVAEDAKSGVRIPARRIVLRLDTLFSPPIGAVPDGPWADLVAALTAEPNTAELGPLLAGMITGDPMPRWRREEADLGLANGDMLAMGLGPVTGVEPDGGLDQDQAADEVENAEVTVTGAVDPIVVDPAT